MEFEPGPIGLVIEMRSDFVVCTGVVPESQASAYEELLRLPENEARILSVNGHKLS
jgi:hypothetical protein